MRGLSIFASIALLVLTYYLSVYMERTHHLPAQVAHAHASHSSFPQSRPAAVLVVSF
jgi:hypothetical protein